LSAAEQLRKLHELQLVDLKIMELEKFYDLAPMKIEQLEADIQSHRTIVEEREAVLVDLKTKRREKEKNLEEYESRVEKNKTRMMAVKTNEEYHAIQKENDSMHRMIEEIEDEALRVMDDIDEAELALRKAKDRFTEIETTMHQDVDRIKKELDGIKGRLDALKDERATLAQSIDKDFLFRYDRLRKTTAGIAVVRVIKRTCQGCLMNVSPQTYNMVIRNEEIITCPNCYRILYYSEDDQSNNQQEKTSG